MKLAMYTNVPVVHTQGGYKGIYYNDIEPFARLAEYFDEVLLLVPVIHRVSSPGLLPLSVGRLENTRIVELPYFVGDQLRAPYGLRGLPRVLLRSLPRMSYVVRYVDVVGSTIPTILGTFFSIFALLFRKPLFHWVRGDKQVTLAAIYPQGVAHYAVLAGAFLLESYARWAIRKGVPTFVVGEGLYKKYEREIRECSLLRVITPVLMPHFGPPPNRLDRVPADETARILFVGRLSPEKGVDVLLHALALIRDHHQSEIKSIIAGDGPQRARLEDLARELNLSRVSFVGFVPNGPELVRLYQEADVLVVPSRAEAFGAVIAEGMACGLPVIASNVGGIPGIVKHGINGLLVPPNSPEQLAGAILNVVNNPEIWRAFSKSALETTSRYRIDGEIAKLVESLQDHYGLRIDHHKVGE